jgi:lipoprotein-releasing system permease protein
MSRRKLPALFIGLRYLLAKRDNRFIAFTSLISMAGLTLGVLALIVVLSIFNGSQGVMRDRTLITVPHADLSAAPAFNDWQQARTLLLQQPAITAVAPYTQVEALLSEKGYHQVTQVRGIDPVAEASVSTVDTVMYEGSLAALEVGKNGIVIGRNLANNLRLQLGSNLNLLVPLTNAAGTSFDLALHPFTVVGIFDVQFNIGADLAYVHLSDSAALLPNADLAAGIHLRLKTADINVAKATVASAVQLLSEKLPGPQYVGKDWSTTESSLFNALRLEKFMTWLMLMMIVAIGAFNIVSTLVMVVAEKQPDIAILRTMGAGRYTILAIFMVQGTAVGVLGISLGALLGSLIARNFAQLAGSLEQWLSPDSVYLISALPARWQGSDVAITCGFALLISFLATLYPAWKASRIHPAQVLRYA